MYATGPPAWASALGEPLGISRACRRVFDGMSDSALHPDLRVYLADLVRPYGLALREDLLARGSGQCYGEMGAALISATVPADQPIDLLVLAFAVADVRPERSTASYLSYMCPGEPMAFAVCDQGAAAAFTALRLIREYARTPECGRALLLVIEQATLHHDPAGPAPAPARHAAVALICDPTGSAGIQVVRQHVGIAPAQVTALLMAELTDLTAGCPGATLVIGHDLARLVMSTSGSPAVAEMRVAPLGQPSTGVWWELAGDLLARAAGGQPVLLAEYEQSLGYLCLSVIGSGPPSHGLPAGG